MRHASVLSLLLLASPAAADAPTAGPPAGKPAPKQAPAGEVAIIGKQAFDDTTLTVDMIITKLNMVYMNGVKHCYAATLQHDPTARGRLVLRFTVTPTGQLTNVETRGFNEFLDNCIGRIAPFWTFPIPKTKAKKAVEASFAFDLAFD